LKLKPFFFAGVALFPVTALTICLIRRDIAESDSTSGVAVVCMFRTAA
jgi:hypothetical protein